MITIENLTKRYGATTAVSDVSFTCRPGTVTGFLGPNGAGKSTTLRILCGLATPSSGSATVLGVPYRRLDHPGRRVGVLLDAAAQHSGRTGRESLVLSADVLGIARRRVDELLELVDLNGSAARRRIGRYSLGMRQRLGLAHALLGDPQVLILDEPANGLDPAGIAWMRDVLRRFADAGGTVLLSSHLLHEVQATADHLVIIADGRIAAQGSVTELLSGGGVTVRAADDDRLTACLREAGLRYRSTPDPHRFFVEATADEVGQAAAHRGIALFELREADGGLEELFLTLTQTRVPGKEDAA
jgi:ABC-2 type transport system ATP-binding protein